MSELEEVLEAEVKEKSKRFKGFKATLKVSLEGLEVEVPIRYAKLGSEPLVKIVRRSPSGRLVQGKWIGEKKYFEVDENGKLTDVEVPEDKIKYFQVLEDGTEVEVEKTERTKTIESLDFIPIEQIYDYAPESVYEIWAEDQKNIPTLYKIAQRLLKDRLAILTTFTFGGMTGYTAIIYPIVKPEGFVLEMMLSQAVKEYQNLMPIPTGKPEEKTEKKKVYIPLVKPKKQTSLI
jgi:hypothetical protein